MTTLLIDAANMAYRARHTTDGLSFKGRDTSVLFGVIRMISTAIKKFDADSVVAAWDAGVPYYRRAYCPAYKATRHHDEDPTYPIFLHQVNELYATLPHFGILNVRRIGIEADDIIYQASNICTDYSIVISTDDDLMQTVSEHTSYYNPYKDVLISTENFPYADVETWLMMKTFVGDPSDNLKGVNGVGQKTAKKLVGRAHTNKYDGIVDCEPFYCLADFIIGAIGNRAKEYFESGDYEKAFKVINLAPDRTGARAAILSTTWLPYRHNLVMKWCLQNGFSSVVEGPGPAVVYSKLVQPSFDVNGLAVPMIWDYKRYPKEN